MKLHNHHELNIQLLGLISLFFLVLTIGIITATFGFSLATIPRAQTPFQNQGEVDFIGGLKPIGKLPFGGQVNTTDIVYCLEHEDPEGCADETAFRIPKGMTGTAGSCGKVIEQAHLIAAQLKKNKTDLLDSLTNPVENCNYSTASYEENYLPTYFVIDAYNLAGLRDLSKQNSLQTLGENLLNWWKSNPKGFKFIPNSTSAIYQYATGQQDLTGCVLFIKYPSGVHVGLVNSFQLVHQNGDGVLSILQSGTTYLIGRFEVVGWKIKNLTLNPKEPHTVEGFGCQK